MTDIVKFICIHSFTSPSLFYNSYLNKIFRLQGSVLFSCSNKNNLTSLLYLLNSHLLSPYLYPLLSYKKRFKFIGHSGWEGSIHLL